MRKLEYVIKIEIVKRIRYIVKNILDTCRFAPEKISGLSDAPPGNGNGFSVLGLPPPFESINLTDRGRSFTGNDICRSFELLESIIYLMQHKDSLQM